MKRRVLISILFFMAFSTVLTAQNLVPNYSFEDTLQCTFGLGGNQFTGFVSNWSGGGDGLTYYDSLCNSGSFKYVPLNIFGYQLPHTGAAYCGIYTFIAPPPPSRPYDYNLRDYLQVRLNGNLTLGTRYFTTFYVSLADSSKWACNSIGAYFSDSALVYTDSVKYYLKPQIVNDTSHHLTDKINWMKVSGSFIAQGGEAYLIIGNFNDDKHSDSNFVNSPSTNTNHNWNCAYYYIDDVIVSSDSNYADSLETVQNINAPKEILNMFPNPSNGKFIIEMQDNSEKACIEIYNMLGEKVYNNSLNSTSIQINLSNQPTGIYLYRVVSEKGEAIASGKLIIEK